VRALKWGVVAEMVRIGGVGRFQGSSVRGDIDGRRVEVGEYGAWNEVAPHPLSYRGTDEGPVSTGQNGDFLNIRGHWRTGKPSPACKAVLILKVHKGVHYRMRGHSVKRANASFCQVLAVKLKANLIPDPCTVITVPLGLLE